MISETEKYQIATANYQDGFEDGVIKGEAVGMEKQALSDARNLKTFGIDPAIIAQAIGLTEEQVRAL